MTHPAFGQSLPNNAVKVLYLIFEMDVAGTTRQALSFCSTMCKSGIAIELVMVRRCGNCQRLHQTTCP
jgi:hypothetical protein